MLIIIIIIIIIITPLFPEIRKWSPIIKDKYVDQSAGAVEYTDCASAEE